MRTVLIACVRAYRYLLSPYLGQHCRFHPTCSAYAIEALEHHGSLRGLKLALWRLLRCHPFSEGGYDPVPHRTSDR
jgi:putative membrane protein insertion efficiency factor